MKNNAFFLMSIATVMFLSCSDNKDAIEGSTTSISNEPAVLSIGLIGTDNHLGRATGTPTAAEESQVNDGIIYVFDANGIVIKKGYFKTGDITSSTGSKQITTTTAAASISVLLNVGVSDSTAITGTPYDVPTKSQLEALTVALALSNGTGAGTQVKNNLIMSGQSTGTITFSGSPKIANIPVTVSRIVSKISINWVFQPNSAFTNKIRLVGAVILNATSSSRLFGTSLIPPSLNYIEGLPTSVLTAFPAGGYKPDNANMISNVGLMAVSNFAVTPVPENHFYIFENTNVSPTIVALVADFNENGLDVPNADANHRKYYPIVLNKSLLNGQDGTMTIKRNVAFNVTAIVKGAGVDNPFNPIDEASLNITITIAPWALVVNVNQTFE